MIEKWQYSVQNFINNFVFIKINMDILEHIKRKQQIINSDFIFIFLNYVYNKYVQW